MMNDNVFQDIFDKVQDFLPKEWRKVVFYAQYYDGSYSMKYYVKLGEKQYQDCFELGTASRMDLIKLFINLDKVISPARAALKEKWSVMTMVVDEDGTMKTEFDYTDISESFVSYEEQWKKRYLK